MLNPLMMTTPSDASEYAQYNLAVLLEGKFDSAFDEAPAGAASEDSSESAGELETSNYIKTSVMPGKLFVAGSSEITTSQVIDENGQSPVSMFLMNVVDYMNGNEDLCTMRTKSLSVNNLTIKTPVAVSFWKLLNQYGLAVLVALVGLLVWRLRTARRRAINKKYNPDDTRTISK